MALTYSGPGVLRTEVGDIDVHATLVTDLSEGLYSWQGRLSCTDLAALRTERQTGTLTLPVPHETGEVHVVVADLNPDSGGVLLRVHGVGRAPYEVDGDISARVNEGGFTVYERTCP